MWMMWCVKVDHNTGVYVPYSFRTVVWVLLRSIGERYQIQVSWSDHKPTSFTWYDHIEQLQSRIAKRVGVLKRIKHLLPVYARRIYVSTMVIPILEYTSIIWGDKNNKVLVASIQVLQNKSAKLVLDRATHSSSTQALLDLNWMNLSTRRLMQRCFFMHNFIIDSERNSMINRGSDYHSHNTRSKETIRSIRSNMNWGLLRSFNSASTDWNSLPEDMRCLPNNAF